MKNPFDVPPRGPTIDMTPDGRFRATHTISPGTLKVGGIAVLVSVLVGSLAIAALALWLALTLIPFAIAAGLIGYGVLKFQRWQTRRSAPVDLYRR